MPETKPETLPDSLPGSPPSPNPDAGARPSPEPRAAFPAWRTMTTRWRDNDVYGHLNNVVYYEYFDSAVNGWLIERGLLDIGRSEHVYLVAATSCAYFESVGFPDRLSVGLRVERLGRSSVTYAIGLFREEAAHSAALGRFTHVHVARATQRPAPIPDPARAALATLRLG